MNKPTSYNLLVSENKNILEIIVTGEVRKSVIKNLQDEIFNIAERMKTKKLLVDCRNVIGRFGVFEAYSRVHSYPLDIRKWKTAIIDIKENNEFQSFHETVGLNIGKTMKYFNDVNSARVWLNKNDY